MTNNLPSKPKRTRRNHSPEFKAHVIALCREPNASRAEIARRFDLNDNLVHRWCVQAKRSESDNQSFDFIELPASITREPCSDANVTFEYTRDALKLKVAWPIKDIERSIPWIKALGL